MADDDEEAQFFIGAFYWLRRMDRATAELSFLAWLEWLCGVKGEIRRHWVEFFFLEAKSMGTEGGTRILVV